MRRLICYVMIALFAMPTCAQTPSQQLVQLFSRWHSLQATFVQTIQDEKTGHINGTFTGEVTIDKPGRFRWFIRTPNQQLLILNQQKIIIYDLDLEQVTIRKLSAADKATPAAFLTSELSDLSKQFTIQALASQAGETRFLLKPKKPDQLYTEIELRFNKDKTLVSLRFNDHLGQSTCIGLSHVVLNKAIEKAQFELKIPKGVDVYHT